VEILHRNFSLLNKYDGFGGVLSLKLKTGIEAAVKLVNNLKLISPLTNVSDAKK